MLEQQPTVIMVDNENVLQVFFFLFLCMMRTMRSNGFCIRSKWDKMVFSNADVDRNLESRLTYNILCLRSNTPTHHYGRIESKALRFAVYLQVFECEYRSIYG